ncbi:MAG: iron donor protein CyaY [Myxococcota bacterium]|nr:iron donor protein CyaY [Myxococcota bacterium]
MPQPRFDSDADFRASVGRTLQSLMMQADEIDSDDLDVRYTPGNLQIVFEDVGATFVLSQQTPTHELWLSANLTAWHFVHGEGGWIERDSGEDMLQLLGRLVSEKVGESVTFRS